MSDTKINNFVAKHSGKFNKHKAYKKRKRDQEDREAKKEIEDTKKSTLEEVLEDDHFV
jgi:hypothetical protein